MDVVWLAVVASIVCVMLYRRIAEAVRSARSLRADPNVRLATLATVIIICATVSGCVLVESAIRTGPDPVVSPFVIRRWALLVGIAGLAAFGVGVGFRERSAFRAAREAFAAGKRCISCGQPLNLKRLHHPIAGDQEMTEHWLNVCECGGLTLFLPTGEVRPVKPPPSLD